MVDTANETESFFRVVRHPRNKREACLSATIQLLGPESLERLARDIEHVTAEEISSFALENFAALDRYPNPVDHLISDHEIVEALGPSLNPKEQAILVAMWLRFDEIRNTNQDSSGMEAAFDTQLSYADIRLYGQTKTEDVPTTKVDLFPKATLSTGSASESREQGSSRIRLHSLYGDNPVHDYFNS